VPFAFPELVVRIEAVARRAGRLVGRGLQVGNLVFDVVSRQAVVDGKRHIVHGSREVSRIVCLHINAMAMTSLFMPAAFWVDHGATKIRS
jgi:DNA-binding response OmpR family regulator